MSEELSTLEKRFRRTSKFFWWSGITLMAIGITLMITCIIILLSLTLR